MNHFMTWATTVLCVVSIAGCGGGGQSTRGASSDEHHLSAEQVEQYAAQWNADSRAEWQRPERVVELLEVESGMTVVDLGAGTGYFLPQLSEAVGPSGRVIALDIEPELVAYMRRRATSEGLSNVEVREVAPDDPGLGAGSVDRVLVVDTWAHIPDRRAYARRLQRALRPGAQLLIIEATEDSVHGPPEDLRTVPHHVLGELHGAELGAVEVTDAGLSEQFVIRATAAD